MHATREKNADPDAVPARLENLAGEALPRIQNREYKRELQDIGITQIMKIGIAFYKKHVALVSETDR